MTTIRIVDIETTGLVPPVAEVIEFGWWDAYTDGTIHRVSETQFGSRLYAPERACPPEVMSVHHILPRDLVGQPRFTLPSVTNSMYLTTPGVPDYFAAHNAEFEMTFLGGLAPTEQWICTYKAALRAWPDAPSHGNQSLMYWLGLHEEMDEETRHPPHRALPDAYVTAHILQRLLDHATLAEMVQWTQEPRLLPRCPIGEWRGRLWAEVDTGFLRWMISKPVEPDYVWNARRELERRRTVSHRGDA